MSDIYTYPNSDTLINNFNVRDTVLLHAYERKYITSRIIELAEKPINGNFDLKHLKQIHHYLFQDVYPWAGQIRKIDIARIDEVNKKMTEFCPSQCIEGFADDLARKIHKYNGFKNMDIDTFSEKAAELLGELNMLHPFREGNGRTQREFVRELALSAGWELNFDNISRERMVEASIAAVSMDYSQMKDLIREVIRPLKVTQSLDYQNRLREINMAPDVSELPKNPHSKLLYDAYAKAILVSEENARSIGMDKKIIMNMKNDGISDKRICAAINHSPGLLGKKEIEKEITVRTMVQEVSSERKLCNKRKI